ncbi:MAG: nucleotidyltransferase domain-containing protein [Candidatus Aenigmatarchaeota archaeon]
MEIHSLLSTAEKEKLLEYLLDNPSQEIKIRRVAKNLSLSPSHITKFIKLLFQFKIVKEKRINLHNPLTKVLKVFFNLKKILKANIIKEAKKIESLKGIGIYGSWVNGTNYEDSDLDIWIKTEKYISQEEIAKFSEKIRQKLKKNVQILVLTPEKINKIKKEDPIFFYSLVFNSLVLYGESVE